MSAFYDLSKTPRNILNQAIARAIVSENNGALFDPSDLSTLYQDAAGTVPVTAVEQPVGKMLDKSGNGYHATQSVTASQPTLSARYNLLTYSEQLDNSAWTKLNNTNPTYPPVVTPNAIVDHTGKTTADLVTPANIADSSFIEIHQNGPIISGLTYHQYYCVKPNGWQYLQSAGNFGVFGGGYVNFDLVTGTVTASVPGAGGFSGDITPLTDGWFLIHVSATATASGTSHLSINFINGPTAIRGAPATGNGIDGVYVARADLRVGSPRTNYQRIGASTDYDTNPALFPKYLKFDGIDDYLNLPFMNLYGGGAASIIAARNAVSQATDTYIISERSTTNANPKYFPSRQLAGGGNMDTYISDDTAAVVLDTTGSAFIGTSDKVIRSVVDTGNNIKLFKNGALAADDNYTRAGTLTLNNTTIGVSVSTTTGNYASMKLYGLIITKSALTDAQRVRCERFLAQKAGVML